MLPGPVFHVELLTSARRLRNYLGRSLYGLFLLGIVSQAYFSRFNEGLLRSPEVSIREMATFGRTIFYTFVFCQGVAVMVLTPALVAGAIADERQRKTLHYLLASRLSGAEIVLGKLGARLIVLAVFVTTGVPILSILGLFGGVAFDLVAWSYAGTLSTILALAGLSILISVGSKRPRDAILLVFVLVGFWLLAPLLLSTFRSEWPVVYSVIEPVVEFLFLTDPFYVATANSTKFTFEETVLLMIAVHVGLFLVTTIWAVLGLRPGFKNEGARSRLLRVLTRPWKTWRLFPRPACDDEDPMLWKERFVSRLRGRTRAIVGLVGLLIFAGVGYWTVRLGVEAWDDLMANDLGIFTWWMCPRSQFHNFIQGVSGALYPVIAIGVAVSAASSFTSEREQDTWTSLTASTLTGGEMVLAKVIGSIESTRILLATLMVLWMMGVATGTLHPYGLIAGLVSLACFLVFIAALGVTVSLQARTTARALAFTIATLVFLNGGYLLCMVLYMPDSPLVLLGVSPYLLASSLFSYHDIWGLFGWLSDDYSIQIAAGTEMEWYLTQTLGPLIQAGAAVLLIWRTSKRFDEIIDRPHMTGSQETPTRPVLESRAMGATA